MVVALICVSVCVCAAAGPAFELSLTWAEWGRAAGRGGDGRGNDAQQSPHLLPFHLPLPASNNKLFNSAIFAASHPQTLEAPTRSCCLIQCSEKNSWLESDFFILVLFSISLPKTHHPLVLFSSCCFFPPLWHQNCFCPVSTKKSNSDQKNIFEHYFVNVIKVLPRYQNNTGVKWMNYCSFSSKT